MESHRSSEDDGGQAFLRLPVRRIEAIPEVAQRLRGDAPAPAPGSIIPGGRPGMEGFPWARSASTSKDLLPADAGPDLDTVSDGSTGAGGTAGLPAEPSGVDADGDLTDWQRQWLAVEDDGVAGGGDDGGTGGDEDGEVEQAPQPASPDGWWEGIPAIRQFLLDGLDLGPATVFVGENGSGKSTIVEGVAMAYGLAAEGGSIYSRHRTRASESGLGDQLAVIRGGGASKGGYFLRAETMHSFFTYLEENPGSDPEEPIFHELSHGEAFVALAEVKFKKKWPGLVVLDEPESALSFDNQLRLLRHLQMLMSTGRHQVVMATHSPILAALPGATLYELDAGGFHEVDHDDATLVRTWRHFMNDPAAFLDD